MIKSITLAPLLFLISAVPVHAQDEEPRESYTTAITDSQLHEFAEAVLSLQQIDERYSQRIAEAPSNQKEQLQERAAVRMTETVESHGLSPGTFNRIIMQARHDQAMSRKIRQYVRQVAMEGA